MDPAAGQCRVTRLTETDVKRRTDDWQAFRSLILTNEAMYPTINTWLDTKVAPSLASLSRTAFLAYIGDKPVASAVLKRGESSKFCHLRISENFQDKGLGDVLFTLMALDVRSVAHRIHFTLPESLWASRQGFFSSFGFTHAKPARTQYRLFEREFECSALVSDVIRSAMSKLPSIMSRCSIGEPSFGSSPLLMSVRPKFVQQILAGTKRVEIRKVFSQRWAGHRVALYASDPICSLVGEATIAHVVPGTPGDIWEAMGANIGCCKATFDSYVGSTKEVFAIVLRDVHPYTPPVKRADVSKLIGQELRPPQSYMSLLRDNPWMHALATARSRGGARPHRSL